MSSKQMTPKEVLEMTGYDSVYAEIFLLEHPNHPIITEQGTLRWQSDPVIDMVAPGGEFPCLDLNQLFMSGADKNDPRVRELYRRMGYSLYGYWEVFYMNNDEADEYHD